MRNFFQTGFLLAVIGISAFFSFRNSETKHPENYKQLIAEVMFKIDDELKINERSHLPRTLSKELIDEISLLSRNFIPYHLEESKEGLKQAPISPGRALLLLECLDKKLDRITYDKIYQICNFSGALFENVDLSNAYLKGAFLAESHFQGANLTNTNFERTNLNQANLEGANLTNTNLSKSNMKKANLREAILKNAILENTYLVEANLTNVNLTGLDLTTANLNEAIIYFTEGYVAAVGNSKP